MRGIGNRIPQDFRRQVSYRIRLVMNPEIKQAGTLTTECKDMANNLGLHYMTIWFWYNGLTLPTLYNLVRFADWYDVSIDYLLGRTAVKELASQLKVIQGQRKAA